MKTYTLDQIQDELIGKVGTSERELFEYELQMDLIGKAIKQTRQERNLTQEELGKLIGVIGGALQFPVITLYILDMAIIQAHPALHLVIWVGEGIPFAV